MSDTNVRDIYPLSPMQLGMMFHSLNELGSSVYVEQLRFTLEGLDAARFRRAWEHVFERHAVLRTSIAGTGRDEPGQVVRSPVPLPWHEEDLRGLAGDEQKARLESFLQQDCDRGFALNGPTLVRLSLLRLSDDKYELVWTLHHIILDGWSGALVTGEVFACYDALGRNEEPRLAPTRPFRDYIVWLREQDMSGAETYWRETLAGFTVPTSIGADRPDRVSRSVTKYAEEHLKLSAELTSAIGSAARSGRVTVNTVLQGAWALLLARYAREDDVLFGNVISGRPDAFEGVDRMVGMFVNTLPVRVRIPTGVKSRAWLQTLQASQIGHRQHEYSPLWHVQKWSDVPAGERLFESLFVFQNQPRSRVTARDLKVTATPPFDRTGVPLLLLVAPTEEMQLRLTYDAERFEPSTIRRVLTHFRKLLEGMATDPSQRVSELSLLSEAERQQLLVAWNDTAAAYPADTCVHELFEAQVERTPDAVAVVFGDQALTYGQLNQRANQVARHLCEQGVGPDARVAILLKRSVDVVVALVATLKAGGAYVPLDPTHPPERIGFMLADCDATVVLTLESELELVPDIGARVVCLDRDERVIRQTEGAVLAPCVAPGHLAYVLYTSGSTGRPKGVAMPHGALVNLLRWQMEVSPPGAADRTAQFGTLSFDLHFLDIFATLSVGGAVFVVSEDERRDPAALLRFLKANQITRMFMPYVALRQMAEEAAAKDVVPSSLRLVISAGESLQITPAITRFFAHLPECVLCNEYGPAETHVVTALDLTTPPEAWPARPSVGRPIVNTRIYILDDRLEPMPIGVPGELYIGGVQVARGYLGRPQLTAERFVPDPFGDEPDGRLYYTGDLARYRPDGNIEFLGRADHQVKVRGYRIELGEIEVVLEQHGVVEQAVAMVREDRAGDRRLVAYVVPTEGASLVTSEVLGFLRERLPSYMVPSALVQLEALPWTPSGKIDRMALPAPDLSGEAGAFVAPRNGTEAVLCAIWSDVLGVDRVGVHDNFFELGGHSLLATQLIARIRRTLEIEVPLRDLFDCPTVAELATRIHCTGARPETPPLVRCNRDGDLPLSFAQQRLWFLDQMEVGAAYNMPMALRLRGRLAVDCLEQALQEVLRRHEALRTSFPVINEQPVQRIAGALEFQLTRTDVGDLDAEAQEAEVRRLAEEEAGRPFDLATGPLVRGTLLTLGDVEHVLLLTMHHIVSDGWSMGVLFRELTTLYEVFSQGEASPLAELEIQYADFAQWQRSWLEGEALDEQLSYWREQLANVPTLDLPTDRQRPAVQTFNGAAHAFELPSELYESVQRLSRQEGLTLAMVLLAGWQVLLSRYCGQDDVAVGSPIANRTHDALEPLIGFFVNTLVMRTDLSGDPSVEEVLRRVQAVSLSAYEHQDVPFEQVVDELNPPRDLSRHPLFQVSFAMQNAPRATLRLGDLEIDGLGLGTTTTRFDLELHCSEHGDRVVGRLVYNTDLFEASTIERMADHLVRLLEEMASGPSRRVSELPLLSESERHQLLVEWNDTAASYPDDTCIHELFEEQVERTPDAVAVVFGDESLTYGQLNARANQVAHTLRGMGVGVEDLVGLCVGRSVEMVVGLLGILKAGGAYVPLDPDYPEKRLAFMLEDSDVSVLVTQASLLQILPDLQLDVLCLDGDASAIGSACSTNPAAAVTVDHLAYVIYTSGSTGRPKGVVIAHGNGAALVAWARTAYEDEDLAGVLAATSMCFDLSVFEMFVPLSCGGSIILAENALALPTLPARDRVTLINTIPSAMAELVRQDGIPRSVRTVNLAGEPLTPALVDAIYDMGVGRVFDLYGPSEDTTYTTGALRERGGSATIGRPLANEQVYLLDGRGEPVPVGVCGELYTGGDGLACGYLNDAALTGERFVPNPFGDKPGSRLYRTGDLARYRSDGTIEFIGRVDHQVKVRGYRIELGEIEAALAAHEGVDEAVVLCREDTPGEKALVAYVARSGDDAEVAPAALRTWLGERLPSYMVPSSFVLLGSLPLTPNGKVDRRALPRPSGERQTAQAFVSPRSEMEQQIAAVWREVLGVDRVGVRDNFFDLGGHSLQLLQVRTKLVGRLGHELRATDLFQYPTVEALAARLADEAAPDRSLQRAALARVGARRRTDDQAIAVVAMAGRFPGAPDLQKFWENLREGVESIRFFTDEELRSGGVPESLLSDPDYVRARGVLDGADLFDAWFFGYTPREAELIDPQQRVFLECAWEALERAGCDPARYDGLIGVWAGVDFNGYFENLRSHPEILDAAGSHQVLLASGTDFLPTRVSYKLNLKGPSVNVQTACSTSLVAVHEACEALREHRCDMALAGGASVTVPLASGYVHQPDGILSPDGHCRAFDAEAKGTVGANGVGVVVLKRLAEAERDGDRICAVIRGTATNNDGARKVGFTAPSVEGQAEVIALAQASAGFDPASISYVEAHGTGTALGDPIEVAALHRVFSEATDRRHFCALGSLKSNIGHLGSAAGVGGLIKTVLALQHQELPPTLHYAQPNPEIDFENSTFYVNTTRRKWEGVAGVPRRAGVSSFGLGGTNAHAVLEEAPAPIPADAPLRNEQVLVLSAKTPTALQRAAVNLAAHLEEHPEIRLADVAWTQQTGREEFEHRRMVVASDVAEACAALRGERPNATWPGHAAAGQHDVAFLFPGQGAQYVGMGRELYAREAVFRETVDHCRDLLAAELETDLGEVLYPTEGANAETSARLKQTSWAQPALFVIEYALAAQWRSWGIEPSVCVGHSIGEFVAACVSGVLRLEDALRLVALRGRLMERMPAGVMTAVPMSADALAAQLAGETGLWLAAVNGPSLCVVSGTEQRVAAWEAERQKDGIECRRLHTSHAFHSGLMEEAAAPFIEAFQEVEIGEPRIPYVSNVTGTWITAEDVRDPSYWGRHIRHAVRFGEALEKILPEERRVLLEVGPGEVLGTLARQQPQWNPSRVVVPSLRRPNDETRDVAFLLGALGRLWAGGVSVPWEKVHGGERRRRVELPTYPFERERYWIERAPSPRLASADVRRADLADWFHAPSWRRTLMPAAGDASGHRLVLTDGSPFARHVAERLETAGCPVVVAVSGDGFARDGDRYVLDPTSRDDHRRLLVELVQDDRAPRHIVHLLGLAPAPGRGDDEVARACVERCFYSPIALAQAIDDAGLTGEIRLDFVTAGVHDVNADDEICPEKATILGPVRVIACEFPDIICRHVDVAVHAIDSDTEAVADRLAQELLSSSADAVVAHRNDYRFVESLVTTPVGAVQTEQPTRLSSGATYLITGGLGGIGLELARYLVRGANANVVLTSRTPLPERAAWSEYLEAHGEDDATSVRIRAVQGLERLGAQVMVAEADVADLDRMRAVFDEAAARLGPVRGVIHSAGVPGEGVILLKEREPAERVLAPKLWGARALERLCEEQDLDFVVLCSSLASAVGIAGQVDYCAANAYLDAFAHHLAKCTGIFTVSIGWNRWREVGMAVEAARAAGRTAALEGSSNREGVELFRRILAGWNEPQVAIAERDPFEMLRPATRRGADETTVAGETDAVETLARIGGHARPNLPTAYVAPRTATERELVAVWQMLLGIDRIGIHDSFFDLGGHSLLATQLLNRLRRTYPSVLLSLRILFDHPTTAGLAGHVDQSAGAAEDDGIPALREQVLAARPNEREVMLRRYLVSQLAKMLDVDGSRLQDDTDLADRQSETLIADLMWALKRDFQLTVFAHELRDRLSVSGLTRFVAGELDLMAQLARAEPGSREAIVIEPPARGRAHARTATPEARNGEASGGDAIFILSAPRSGSTVFRLMLAGHSGLYAPPEFSLLPHAGIRQWTESLLRLYARDTVVQAFAAFLGMVDVEAAGALLDELTRRDAPIEEVYRLIQEHSGERTLVDKSPGYALHPETLERAEALFEHPRYVHLVRHPYAVIESLVRNRMAMLDGTRRADPYGHAERRWAISNGNIEAFLAGVDADRWIRLRYEDLVSDPKAHLCALCEFLALDFEPSMLNPYGKGRVFAGFGDPNILSHRAIEPRLGEAWREIHLPRRLSDYARGLAESFAYELPNEGAACAPGVAPVVSVDGDELATPESTKRAQSTDAWPATPPLVRCGHDGNLPLSFAQQRLWFLDQMGVGAAYHIPMALRLRGQLDVECLEQALQEIIRRHEALRTSFPVVNEQPVQRIAEALEFQLTRTDVGDLDAEAQEAEVRRLAEEEAGRPFDLATGPLVRGTLLTLGDAEHVLLLTMHHIVSDGWSMGVLFRELTTLYEAFSNGEGSPLAELEIQYGDFARWQRSWLEGEVLDEQLSYWREHLADMPTLDLSTDRRRPAEQTFDGASHGFEISSELGEALQRLSRQEGLTLAMVLLAGWQVLLSRYCGQDDVAVGSPIANRTHDALEPLIGFFVNTLVMRTDLSGDPSVEEVLRRVQAVSLSAYEHQDVPFEQVVDELNPPRDLSRHPLFQVSFAMQNAPRATLRLGDLEIDGLGLGTTTTRFDLELHCSEHGDRVVGRLVYNTDLFEASTIERMADHLVRLLEEMASGPSRRVSELPLLSESERHQLLVEWNDTAASYPDDTCIHELFEEQVERTPDAVAVVFGEKSLTYRQLNERANQVAHTLRGMGVVVEDLVGLCVERSLEMVVGMLGILKAGGAYVPLDPTYPRRRLAFMLEDSGVSVLVTQASLLQVLPDLQLEVLRLDRDASEIGRARSTNPSSLPTAGNLAYVIYTSGSTGRPKGVEVQHGSLLNLVHWHHRVYTPTPADRATQLAAIGFDACVWEVWPNLTAGASIHIIDDELRNAPASKLWSWLVERGITTTFLPTPLTEVALREPRPEGLGLRTLLTGGDRLQHGLDRPLPFELVNHYGPTESTVVATCGLVDTTSPPPIGRPIANTRIHLLDASGHAVPVGVPGELFIGGVQLARGYLGRPALTAERFIPDPFTTEPGQRLYRTGDLARYCTDGDLEFLGRLDHQVKVRGFRIELGEIESVLGQHASVDQAVALAREDRPGDRRLVVYVVPTKGASLDSSEVQDFLKDRLPAYMVPSAVVQLELLPLTPNGKVDRKALPDVSRGQEALVVPATPMEKLLAEVWNELIGIDQVDVRDNFFDIGGHSLLMVQAAARMEERTGVQIDLRQFALNTLRQLAQVYDTAVATAAQASAAAPNKRPLWRRLGSELALAMRAIWGDD